MAQHTIRFRIHPDGTVEELVQGFRGEGCQQLTERIESSLGSVQQRTSTAEAFLSQVQTTSAALPVEQRSA